MHKLDQNMSALERQAAASIALIYAFRMLGLFMILPVFFLYSNYYDGATPTLMGLAFGAYGMSQALLQIPMGMLSDRIGRKPIIIGGLVLFALGSAIAAMSDSIYGVMLGRIIQGAGAVAGALLALAADLTREEHRTKVMAIIGSTIGISFTVALILGPILDNWFGIAGIFWLTCLFAFIGIAVVVWLVPTPQVPLLRRDVQIVPEKLGDVLRNTQLLRLNGGVLILHLMLTANFVVIPLSLKKFLDPADHWMVYAPVLVLSLVIMMPLIMAAERRRWIKPMMMIAVFALVVVEWGYAFAFNHFIPSIIFLGLFFIFFNWLEASQPSLVAKTAGPDVKGTAMGIYATCQFLGAFLGGAMGGWLFEHYGVGAVFIFCAILCLIWLPLVYSMDNPRYLRSYMLRVAIGDQHASAALAQRLEQVRGVAEAVVVDGVAYLKVDMNALDHAALDEMRIAA